jgi:hypothetical protein
VTCPWQTRRERWRRPSVLVLRCLAALALVAATDSGTTVWRFDNLKRIGGLPVAVEGDPRVQRGPNGKAVRFDGTDDSVLVEGRPLVGVERFTAEVVFRPEGGPFEQRFMHIAETDPVTGLDTAPAATGGDPNGRLMFEIRVEGDSWYLDTFVKSKAGSKALINPSRKHPLGRWYAVAQTYDGMTYRSYVDGVLEGEANVKFAAHGPGRVRVGARMNQVNHFRGSVALARFTARALEPSELLQAAK